MMPLFGFRSLPAGSPLALVDTYAKTLGVRGEFPPPVGDVNVRVLGQTLSGSFRSFSRLVTALFQRTPTGYFNLTGKIRMANGGIVKLSQGNFRFEIDGRFYRNETRDLALNPDRTERVQIDLVPNEYYPFPPSSTLPSVSGPCRLHGSLPHSTGGDPLAGVLVHGSRSRSRLAIPRLPHGKIRRLDGCLPRQFLSESGQSPRCHRRTSARGVHT